MKVFSRDDALVIGVGNLACGDDAAGLMVARALRDIDPDGVRCLAAPADALGLLAEWREARLVVVVGATQSGAAPGTVGRFDATRGPLPGIFRACSAQGVGVLEVIELARVVGKLPRRLVVFGIEGRGFAPGDPVGGEIEGAVAQVVRNIQDELAALFPDHSLCQHATGVSGA